ncbi:glycosyl hydrolase family 18 protein [Francisellaceae bacterium]|nr:glycosyl hydrolase family 18 protein [Francisellaceae bacterium]
MFKRILLLAILSFQVCSYASTDFQNIAYVQTNSYDPVIAANFVDSQTQKPFFNTVVFFGANINGSNINTPIIHQNTRLQEILSSSQTIEKLHSLGMKVVIALLGNNQAAGWATITKYSDAKNFAKEISQFVNRYNFDGIAIDNEYSTGASNNDSMLKIVYALRHLQSFEGKTVSKVLLKGFEANEKQEFTVKFRGTDLATLLDSGVPGWYPGNISLLNTYLGYGMKKENLYGAVQQGFNTKSTVTQMVGKLKNNAWAGVMVFNVTPQSLDYLNAIYQVESPGKSLIQTW